MVGREQPVEREEAGEQRAKPENRRPSRASSARSGPTANGIKTTTLRKNSTPIIAPPPTRSAILMSLRTSAARAVMRGQPFPSAGPMQSFVERRLKGIAGQSKQHVWHPPP